jgi:hypothetical protein
MSLDGDSRRVTSVISPARMADVEEVEVVVAHHERATLRVGDIFLKIDTAARARRAPVPMMAEDRRDQTDSREQARGSKDDPHV